MGRIYCLNILSLKKGGGILTHSLTPKFKPSDEDIACKILTANGRPMYYYDLIREVLSSQDRPLDPTQISGVLTQINLDARFSHLGNGEWGLKAWTPIKVSRKLSTMTLISKELVDDEVGDLDAYKDLLSEDSEEEMGEEVEGEPEEDSINKEDEHQGRKGKREKDAW